MVDQSQSQIQAPAQVGKPKKEYTQEEYSAMNLKYLGRLKAQGYAVDEVMRTKRREKKDKAFDAKRRKLEEGAEGTEEQGGEEEGRTWDGLSMGSQYTH
ncbi:MAG: hypothetical protein EOO65_04120 [Methanosarcinales archaeon]|nr:MAG: hypothetical protein EOO65_04120 [Methanosarcinales archaeon]